MAEQIKPLRQKSSFGLRLRIFLLLLTIIIPIGAVLGYDIRQRYLEARQDVFKQAEDLVRIVAAEQLSTLLATEHLLRALSNVEAIKSSGEISCPDILQSIIGEYRRYSNMGVVDDRGMVVCSAKPLTEAVDLADRPAIETALKESIFSVGVFFESPITGKPSLIGAYPLAENDGVVRGALYSALDLDWLAETFSKAALPKDSVLLMVDRDGVMLAHAPDQEKWLGKNVSSNPLIIKGIQEENPVAFEEEGLDKVNRLYATSPLAVGNQRYGTLAVGIPLEATLVQTRELAVRNILTFGLVLIVIFLISLFLANVLIVKAEENFIALKDEFVDLASHQLKTPASGVKAFLSMLISGDAGKLTAKQQIFADKAYQANERELRLISDLLHVARIEGGRFKLEKKEVDLGQLIKKIADEQRASFRGKSQELVVKVPDSPLTALIDADKINMAVGNLVENAHRYTPENGTVTITLGQTDQAVTIAVRDTGLGISREDQAKLFAKFSRLDNKDAGSVGGTGLGLYLVKTIIDLHGGQITVDSEEGRGSTFTISLPKVKEN